MKKDFLEQVMCYCELEQFPLDGVFVTFYNKMSDVLKQMLLAVYEERNMDWVPDELEERIEALVYLYSGTVQKHSSVAFIEWISEEGWLWLLENLELICGEYVGKNMQFKDTAELMIWLAQNENARYCIRKIAGMEIEETCSNATETAAYAMYFTKDKTSRSISRVGYTTLMKIRVLLSERSGMSFVEVMEKASILQQWCHEDEVTWKNEVVGEMIRESRCKDDRGK